MASNAALPGGDLVNRGLEDLRAGRATTAALLVAMARQRLTTVGHEVPELDVRRPSHALYELLAAEDPGSAHVRYDRAAQRGR